MAPPPPVPSSWTLEGLQARCDIGRTKAFDLVAVDGLPPSVVPGMHRYPVAAVEARELAFSLRGTVAQPAAPAPVVVAPPAPGRPGRRPGANRRAGH